MTREDQTITMAAAAELIRQARADEGKRNAIAEVERAWAERADLRANVEALDVFVTTNNLLGTTRYVRLGDVLALLDGATDV